jgi:hypothetical protein
VHPEVVAHSAGMLFCCSKSALAHADARISMLTRVLVQRAFSIKMDRILNLNGQSVQPHGQRVCIEGAGRVGIV